MGCRPYVLARTGPGYGGPIPQDLRAVPTPSEAIQFQRRGRSGKGTSTRSSDGKGDGWRCEVTLSIATRCSPSSITNCRDSDASSLRTRRRATQIGSPLPNVGEGLEVRGSLTTGRFCQPFGGVLFV